ncbi:MAG: efflux RND transporter periplasmic adaptor subunit [Rhodospirillaceae bacterium]|nr:efflux RND transporter periplasmic adaptor subunit [Rhodospirillaceae bacterium]
MAGLNKAQVTAIAIIAAGALWIGSGMIGRETNPLPGVPSASNSQADVITTVRIAKSQAQPYQSGVILQGRTVASRSVDLRSEVSGRIEKILVDRGQLVKQGQEMILIAVNDREARLDQARAALSQREMQAEAARQLAKQSFQSQVKLAEAEAQLAQAKADVSRFTLDLANTRIKAPFDGVLDTRLIDEGALLNLGDRIGTVVDLDPIKITAQLSERNVGDARLGLLAKIVLTDGKTLEGQVSYIASVSDPNTRTFTIEVLAPNSDGKVLSGLAAQLRLPFGQNTAHRISPSVMTLSDEGKIGVKSVDDEDRVKFWPVEILDDGPEGTWVSGLPDQLSLIVVGQEYVAVGQKVSPVVAEGAS